MGKKWKLEPVSMQQKISMLQGEFPGGMKL